MSDNRIPTHFWVGAFIRNCLLKSIPVTVIRKGEKLGGTVLIKLYQSIDTCRVMAQTRNSEHCIEWYPIHKQETVDEQKASSLIDRSVSRDPDLWVIEVESLDTELPFE